MELYTIGFTQKSAQQFFELLRASGVKLLIDIRLNNASQLAGFSKGNDLKYFLAEICGCDYVHRTDFAPTKEIMDGYKGKIISWPEFEEQYKSLIDGRDAISNFDELYEKYGKACLLCSEPIEKNCHRLVLADMITAKYPQVTVTHL